MRWNAFVATVATFQAALAYLAIKRTHWIWWPMPRSQSHGTRVAFAAAADVFAALAWLLALWPRAGG